jgi:hypothetical protein
MLKASLDVGDNRNPEHKNSDKNNCDLDDKDFHVVQRPCVSIAAHFAAPMAVTKGNPIGV